MAGSSEAAERTASGSAPDSAPDSAPSQETGPASGPEAKPEPLFEERPREPVVRDALLFGGPLLLASGVLASFGQIGAAWAGLGLSLFVAFFFRNPRREIAGDERTVVAPADGVVIDVGPVDRDGVARPRVGIFLSIFDVHVNRSPVAGRVTAVERAGERFRAAFAKGADDDNARCVMRLETDRGEPVEVVQIVGLVARRIVCHPRVGEWVRRGDRYGLIRFGSRTDVVLPVGSELLVSRGARVRGGSSALARLPGSGAKDAS